MNTKLQLGVYRFFNETNKNYETIVLTRSFNKFYWSVNSYKTLDFSVLKKGLFGKRKVNNHLLEFNFFKNKHPRLDAKVLSETSFQISETNTTKKFIKENNLRELKSKEFSLKLTLLLFIGMSLFFICQMVKPYFNSSLERQKIYIGIPAEIKILATKNTFITSKGVGKLRFPIVKDEEQVNLYVKTKSQSYKTRYFKSLGEKLREVLPVKNVINKRINFDTALIKNFKMLYNNSNEISELVVNDTPIKVFKQKRITILQVIPVLISCFLLTVFVFLLVFLWNEP